MSSFEQRRQQAYEASRVLIARARTSDRQVSDILLQHLYQLAHASRLVTMLVAVVLPGRASRISPLAPNRLPLRRQRTK